MPKGRKIDISDYEFISRVAVRNAKGEFEIDEATGEAKTERKSTTVPMAESLTSLVLNPNLGGSENRPDPEFDLYELGGVCREIDKAYYSSSSLTLDTGNYNKLKRRVEKLCKLLGKMYFEMVRRVLEAEEVELEEKPKLKSE